MEKLMQYVWQHRLWLQEDMLTVDGRRVRVIDPGRLNTDAGPDFFNAKVSIDGRVWAGDIEIHVKASDWYRHGHDNDPAYDSVILHVVDRDDTAIHRRNGEVIPQICMPCSDRFVDIYRNITGRADIDLPCAPYLKEMPPIYLTDWVATLTYERINTKVERIEQLLERFNGDWESACYVTVARSLGFGTNGEPFERLASQMPLRFIGKHSDSLLSIEALLFGRSGLLDSVPQTTDDPYVNRLRSEYKFFAHKFGITPNQPMGWKMARMRPANFPHRRIALLAAMLHCGFRLMSRILEVTTPDEAAELFTPRLTGYWLSHYNFGTPASGTVPATLSRSSVHSLIINTIVPLQYAYGLLHDDAAKTDRAIALLQSLPPERNSIVDVFSAAGIQAKDASQSQALIQLRKAYCLERKCIYCRIGHRLFATGARRHL